MNNIAEKRGFVWWSLRISFVVMFISFWIIGQMGISFFLFIMGVVPLLFNFVVSIIHLKKHKKKLFPLIALVVSSIFIIICVFGFIFGLINSSLAPAEQQSNVVNRDCVNASNGIMSCDGTGITNAQECKDVCLKENGLINTRYITNIGVNSKNLGYGTFNGCYCYDDSNNIKYMYIAQT